MEKKQKNKTKQKNFLTKSNTKRKNKNITKPKTNKYMATKIRRYRQLQGMIIRSKQKIINQEKPNKFFYQQKKQKHIKKQIKQLQKDQYI